MLLRLIGPPASYAAMKLCKMFPTIFTVFAFPPQKHPADLAYFVQLSTDHLQSLLLHLRAKPLVWPYCLAEASHGSK